MPVPANNRLFSHTSLQQRCRWVAALLCCWGLTAGWQAAAAQPTTAAGAAELAPGAQPLGTLSVQYAGRTTRLDAAQLAALPQHTTRTSTPWTDGIARFNGPLVRDVLQAAGVRIQPGMKVQAEALNGYVIDIPAQDFLQWPVVLAFSMDGKTLTRRDKGPLWIVYPRDSDVLLQDAKYDHRWAWQLSQLRISDAAR